MALFDVDAILSDEQELKTIICDFFDLPEGVDVPTVTVEITGKTRELYSTSVSRYNNLKIRYRKGKEPEGVIINEPIKFCHDILNGAYIDSDGLFEAPSKKAILALVKKQPKFAKALSGKLMDAFESSTLYKEEEDDEKN